MLQWFLRFSEFTKLIELIEVKLYLEKTPLFVLGILCALRIGQKHTSSVLWNKISIQQQDSNGFCDLQDSKPMSFSGRCLLECTNHIYPYWFHAGVFQNSQSWHYWHFRIGFIWE